MGSNMAENHPVGFQWVMEAKHRGAKIFHVDPRFSRTSAMAHRHIPLRAGSDIAFLGALVNHVITRDRWFRDYVLAYTNAAAIVSDDFRDTEELDGLFSGFDPNTRSYDQTSWQYRGSEVAAAAGQRELGGASGEQAHGAHGGELPHGHAPEEDPSLEDPRCVFQILKRHFSRYTPEVVEEVCGVPREQFIELAEAVCDNSGRERTTAFVYSVGWTQHTVGVQYIRTASILQLLLGNMGRPGGGIMALRGHASIQGSTDIPTLYNILPGYLPMPKNQPGTTLDDYIRESAPPTGFWGHARAYMVSLLKAWWGEAATADNEFCFHHLPRIDDDHSAYTTLFQMVDDEVEGYFVMGENPVVGAAHGTLWREALGHLKWLVVRDFVEIETASFWRDDPDCQTEVFLMPASSHVEKEGTFTNTQRLLQWRHKALESPGDCRSELWFMYHLGRRIREKLAGSDDPKDRPILDLTWDYPTSGPHEDPSAEAVLKEISGFKLEDGKAVSGYTALEDDGSTACGCWIYSGVYADDENQAARRKPGSEQTWVAPEWGWAWPMNRRILYNRASADPEGRPWSERKRYVWWDADQGKWTGEDVPDFMADTPPDYRPPDDAEAEKALRGDEPFIMQADGRAWLFAPSGVVDGPLPAHYEPQESPIDNLLYGQQANPARQEFRRPDNPYHKDPGDPRYPFVFTTYRLTEHHTAGGMSRWLPYLSELQPEFFCEVSPALAQLRGLEDRGWATISTARAEVEARVLVTDRVRPLRAGKREIHQVGLPYHWGKNGVVRGDSANDLLGLALDPNVHIGEYKAATCDIRPGRRQR
jgi:formate dehydrogenase major subunit